MDQYHTDISVLSIYYNIHVWPLIKIVAILYSSRLLLAVILVISRGMAVAIDTQYCYQISKMA